MARAGASALIQQDTWGGSRSVPHVSCGRSATYPEISVTGLTLEEGASPYGVLHLSGNNLEWVRDYHNLAFVSADLEEILRDPVGPPEGQQRRVRGGYSYSRAAPNCSLAYPDWISPVNQRRGLGFRCTIHGPETSWVEVP